MNILLTAMLLVFAASCTMGCEQSISTTGGSSEVTVDASTDDLEPVAEPEPEPEE